MFALRFQGLGENGVGIDIVDDHDVFVASAGSEWKTPSLITVDLAGGVNGLQEDSVGASAGLRIGAGHDDWLLTFRKWLVQLKSRNAASFGSWE